MATYCRITGNSRGLPKPHYFPLLPPISPADAKRLCRITGKSYGLPTHHYIPVFTRRPKRLKRIASCPVTAKAENQEVHHYLPAAGVRHTVLKDFRYLIPVFESNGELLEILNKKHATSFDGEQAEMERDRKSYVYAVHERHCSIVFPSILEAAVRDGDIRDIMLAKHADTLLLKLRKGDSVEVNVREMSIDEMDLYEGEGPSAGASEKKKRKRVETNEWRRKIFEDKDREADDQEELCLRRIKPKRVKVKLDHINETAQMLVSWRNVIPETISESQVNGSSKQNAQLSECLQHACDAKHYNPSQLVRISNGKLCSTIVRSLPMPTKCGPEIIDLSHSLPGIIQQPLVVGDDIASLPVLAPAAPFLPFVPSSNWAVDKQLKTLNTAKTELRQLLDAQIGADVMWPSEIRGIVKSIVNSIETRVAINERKNLGLIEVNINGTTKQIRGLFICLPNGEETFVPGKVFSTSNGLSFVPGLEIQTTEHNNDGGVKTKFLPGRIFIDENIVDGSKEAVFVVGQTALTRTGEQFVAGQTILTKEGVKFVPGQTVMAAGNDLHFVPGQVVEDGNGENPNRFIPGHTIMTADGSQFVAGKFIQLDPKNGEVQFLPGQYVLNENFNWEFVPGHTIRTDDSSYIFVAGKEILDKSGCGQFIPGQMIFDESTQTQQFVPGITINNADGSSKFVPCMKVQTGDDAAKFVKGMITKDENDLFAFVAGEVKENEKDGGMISFQPASNTDEIVFLETAISNSGIALTSVVATDQNGAEVFGHLVQSSQGVEFFPGEATGLPAGKVIPGKLVKGKDEMRFIPGMMIDNKFIPGQLVTTDKEERFVPGQVIEMTNGPKFVPGQVLNTRSGPKFVPGQTMDTENGPKFIPGQIIETKSGPTFIPGQVIFTEEEGSRFVPGQVVDTVKGPRFVPGRVVETGDYITFIPGQIVETEDGLKFVAPDLEDDPEGGYQFTVQGFEVAEEELNVIQCNSIPYTCFTGKTAIDSKMIKQLSEAGMAVGRQMPIDIPEVDIKPLPFTELACVLASRLNVDSSCTVKMSHILSNLYQIGQQLVIQRLLQNATIKIDECLRPFINALSTCKNIENNGEELLRALGEILENVIIDASPNTKMEIIDVLHSSSTQLALQARDIQLGSLLPKLTCQLVCQIANELNVDTQHAIRMGQILSNLCQITESNLTIAWDNIVEDDDTKSLLKIAFDLKNADSNKDSLFKHLSEALELRLKRDPEHKSQLIDKIHLATCNLSAKMRPKLKKKQHIDSTIEKTLELAEELDLDSTDARKLMKILTNIGHVDNLRAIFISKGKFDNTNHKLLNKLVDIKQRTNDWNQFIQAASKELKNVFENDERESSHIVRSLYEATENAAVSINAQQAKDIISVEVIEESNKIISELNIDPAMLPKLSQILSNLQQIQSLELTTFGNSTLIDDKMKILLKRAIVKNGDKATLHDLAKVLKTIIRSDNVKEMRGKIEKLDSVCGDITTKIVEQQAATKVPSSFVMQMAREIADRQNFKSPTDAVKMGRILSNLYKIKSTGTPILPQGNALDKTIQAILKFAADKMADAKMQPQNAICNRDEEMIQIFAAALDNVIACTDENFVSKSEIIAGLDSCVCDLAAKVTEDITTKKIPVLVLEKVNQIIAKLDGGVANTPSMAMKMGQVITNLQKIKRIGKRPLFNHYTEDDNFMRLLNATIDYRGEADDQQLLEKLSEILEDTIIANSSQPADKVLESIHSLTTKLATNIRDAEIKETIPQSIVETVSQMTDDLNLSLTLSTKLGEMLNSLCEIVSSNGTTLYFDKIEDNNLRTLLENVCSNDVAGKMPEQIAQLLAQQIKKLVVKNGRFGEAANLINDLHASTVNLTCAINRALISEGSFPTVLQTACQIVSKFQLEPVKLIKMVNILSNLQRISNANLPKMGTLIDNDDVKTLIETISSNNEINRGSVKSLENVATILEEIIASDMDNIELTVDTLDAKVTEFAAKTAAQKRNNSIAQCSLVAACELASKLDIDRINVTKLGRILSNMEAIQSANMCNSTLVGILDNTSTSDEHLQTLTRHILEYRNNENNNSSSPVVHFLANTLENIIISVNPKMKIETIAKLEMLTNELATNVEAEKFKNLSSRMATIANDMAVNLNIPNYCVNKIAQILVNINQIERSNGAIVCPKFDDPLYRKVIETVVAADRCDKNSETSILVAAKTIEEIIRNNPDNKVEIIDRLEACTTSAKHSLVDCLQEQDLVSTDVIENAIKIASKLKIIPPKCIPKLCEIVTNIQRINESSIASIVSNGITKNSDHLNKLLKIANECKKNNIGEEEINQKLGETLVKLLNVNPQKAESTMEEIRASTADLLKAADSQQASQVIPSTAIHIAVKIADKMKIATTHVPKLTETLMNLQNIIESNVLVGSVEGHELNSLLHSIIEYQTENAESTVLQCVHRALENCMKKEAGFKAKVEKLEALHKASSTLVQTIQEQKVDSNVNKSHLSIASKLVEKLSLQPQTLSTVTKTVVNLQNAVQSNLPLFIPKIDDKGVEKILKAVFSQNSNDVRNGPELIETLEHAINNALREEIENKTKTMTEFCNISSVLATEVEKKKNIRVSSINETATEVAHKLGANVAQRSMINDILTNLNEIRQSNVIIPQNYIVDKDVKVLVEMLNTNDSNEEQLTSLLAEKLEQIVTTNDAGLRSLETLDAATKNLSIAVQKEQSEHRIPRMVIESIVEVADKLNLKPAQVIKLAHVITNAQQITASGATILTDRIENEQLKTLVNIANKKGTSTELAKAVEKLLENCENKSTAIDSLHVTINDINSEIKRGTAATGVSPLIIETVTEIVTESQLKPSQYPKLCAILSALQCIDKDKSLIANVSNDNLKTVLNAVILNDKTNSGDTLKFIGSTLNHLLSQNVDNKEQILDTLYADVIELAVNSSQKAGLESLPLTVIEVASRLNEKFNVDSTNISGIGAVLSNICEIQKQNMQIPTDAKYAQDENLQTLLQAIPPNCNLETCLPRLERAFETILKSNPRIESKIIDTLKAQTGSLLTQMVTMREHVEKSQISDAVKSSMKTLKLSPESAKKMARIVSHVINLNKSKSAILVANTSIENDCLQQLLKVANNCTNEDLPSTVTKILENCVKCEKDKDQFISNLDELVLHQIQFDIARGEQLVDVPIEIVNKAATLNTKFKLVTSCVSKLCQILRVLQQTKKSKVILSEANIEDENLRILLNATAAIECGANDEQLLNKIQNNVQSMLHQIEEDKRQITIERMHFACIQLADCLNKPSIKTDRSLPSVQISSIIMQNTNLDTSKLPSLVEIVSNLQEIKEAVSSSAFVVNNKRVETLLKTITQHEKENPQMPMTKTLSDVLQKAVQKDPQAIETLIECTSNVVKKIRQSNLDYTKNSTFSTLETANNIVSAVGLKPSAMLMVNDAVSNLLEAKLNSVEFIQGIETENTGTNVKAILNAAFDAKNCDSNNVVFLQSLEKIIGDEIGDKSDSIVQKLFSVSSDIASNSRTQKLSKTVDMSALQVASQVITKLDVDSSQLVNVVKILTNLNEIKKLNPTALNNIVDNNLKTILNLTEEITDDVPNDKFIQNITKTFQHIIDNSDEGKCEIIETLCNSVEELKIRVRSQTDDQFAADIIEVSLELANRLDVAYSSPQCIKIHKMLSSIRKIKQSPFLTSIKDKIDNTDVKMLLNFADECEKSTESVAFLRIVADKMENIIRVDLEYKTEKIDTLFANITDLVLEMGRQRANNGLLLPMVEVACNITEELKLHPSCSLKIGGILSNLRELQNANIAWCYEDEGETLCRDDETRKFAKLALESLNNFDHSLNEQEFTTIVKNSLENTIKGNAERKRQIIDSIHSFTVNLTSKVKDKERKAQNAPLTIDEVVIELVNKLNVSKFCSQKLGLIVSNLIEIKRSGMVSPINEIEDDNLKTLLDLIATDDSSDIQLGKILSASLEELVVGVSNKCELIDVLQVNVDHLTAKIRAKQPNKMLTLKNIIKNEFAPRMSKIENLMALLNEDSVDVRVAFQHIMSEENPDFVNKVLKNTAKMLDKKDAKEVADALHQAIVNAVAETSERKVHKLMAKGESKDFRTLVNEAIALAKALGLSEIVVTLHNILRDGNSTTILAEDAVVMEVLKRLTIMRQLAVKNPALATALHQLQSDPYAARDDPRVRELVRESAVLMVIPEEELRTSEDIPCSLLFSDNSLAVEDFMVKRRQGGKTFLILKKGTQMVVPREAAKDVLTGKVPYTVLDENGIQYFKPLHVFNALKLPRFATDRFSNYGYAPRIPAKTERQLSAVLTLGGATANAANPIESFRLNGGRTCSTQEALANKNACNQMKNRLQGEGSYRY